ncbi:two-component system response regulator [Endozoicomonas sp. (ex Bugula neritina AB1)]|nr:two-component system response regulator [Endozoicomonas sp. (ex Bugula neritina AB1)]
MKILITEDHAELGAMIKEELINAGFITDCVVNGSSAIAMMKQGQYDALILDLGLPDMNGMSVLNAAVNAQVPCLVLTASASLNNRVDALNAGADDYILKPFDMPELEARLRAVLRRPGQRSNNELTFSNIHFNRSIRQLYTTDETLTLARREAALIDILLSNAPRVVVKDYLEEALYSLEEVASTNAVEALISRMRRKLNDINAHCKIETLRGIGYRITK